MKLSSCTLYSKLTLYSSCTLDSNKYGMFVYVYKTHIYGVIFVIIVTKNGAHV